MSKTIFIAAAIVPAALLWLILDYIWTESNHSRRAKQWGCKPAYLRPYRLPFAYDIFKRYLDTAENNELQNDDVVLFEELGRRPTWFQQILGTWHHVTAEPKNIQAMLATQFDDFILGPTRRGVFMPLLGNGIFTVDGKAWEHSRAMLRPQFTRNQVSDLDLEETHVKNLLDRFPTRSDSWTDEVDLIPLLFNFTLDSATEFLLGESVNSQKVERDPTSKSDEIDWANFGAAFDRANSGCLVRFRYNTLYWLYNPKSFRDDCKQVHDFVDFFVSRALDGKKPAGKENAYIFAYELAKETRDPVEIRSQLISILLAGRDTTSGLLGFVFYYLSRDPEIYTRLRKTILEHFGPGRGTITFESLKSCTYLQHTLSEVLRLEAVVPENARHAARNTTLPRGGGPDGMSPIYIRQGEEVMYNTRLMQRRKDLWGEDADVFNPDRWQGYKPGWEFVPFSGGARVCIGQQFALTEAGYVVVRLLQRFDRVENCGSGPLKHRMTQTTAPDRLPLRFHEAEV